MGEWFVFYYDIDILNVNLIFEKGFKFGLRVLYGGGIYISFNFEMVERYYV